MADDEKNNARSRRWNIGCLSGYAVVASFLAFLILRPGPSFEWDGASVDFVETVVPLDVEKVHARLAEELEEAVQRDARFGYSFVHSVTKGNSVSSDMRAENPDNAALERYSRLEESARALDLYINVPFLQTWHSEYSVDGEKVPFRANFLIHLEPLGDAETRIEVVELIPRVYHGHTFRPCSRHLVPTYTRDAHPVAPTTQDRRDVLGLAVDTLRGDSE